MKIGIVVRILKENNNEKEFVNNSYLSFLSRYNFTPIIINTFSLEDTLSICDGFLLPGVDDIDPKYYHKRITEFDKLVDSKVDQLDFKVLDYAIKHQKPVLGICRGLQVINVYFEGTLINIMDDNHISKEVDYLKVSHNSSFVNFRNKITKINSYHHQKIDKLGKNLFVEGISNEAIELITLKEKRIIATQYHLEKLDDQLSKQIMHYFISLFSL